MTQPSVKSGTSAPTTIIEHELQQVEHANATGRQPVVFVHGLWLLPSSWDRWAKIFDDAGYVSLTPGWPDDPETVEEAKAKPEVFANKTIGQVADHYEQIIHALDKKPAVIGHSFGGLLAQILAGRGLAARVASMHGSSNRMYDMILNDSVCHLSKSKGHCDSSRKIMNYLFRPHS